MGCSNSKTKPNAASDNGGGKNALKSETDLKKETPMPRTKQPSVSKKNEPPNPASRSHRDNNGDVRDTASRSGALKGSGGVITDNRSATTAASHQEVDEDGNPVVLPKGDWVRTEGTPFYYSEKENLYFHPPSCQFYDPTNEMWYDPEKDEWYHDDDSSA